MAKNITFDEGMEEFMINGRGPLRFNPSDPNLYHRFLGVFNQLKELEKEYMQKVESLDGLETDDKGFAKSERLLVIMKEIDQKVKTMLSEVFGEHNDFDVLLSGVNVMAFGYNRERVITILLNALVPMIQEGAKKHQIDAATEAVAHAKANREQRRASK